MKTAGVTNLIGLNQNSVQSLRGYLMLLGCVNFISVKNDETLFVRSGYRALFKEDETIEIGLTHPYIARSGQAEKMIQRRETQRFTKALAVKGKNNLSFEDSLKFRVAESLYLDKQSFHHPSKEVVATIRNPSDRDGELTFHLKDCRSLAEEKEYLTETFDEIKFSPLGHKRKLKKKIPLNARDLWSDPPAIRYLADNPWHGLSFDSDDEREAMTSQFVFADDREHEVEWQLM